MSRPVLPPHQTRQRVSMITDPADFSPQYKVSLAKGIWNPELTKSMSPQRGYFLDTAKPVNIHTRQPLSPSRRVQSPSARMRERFQALSNYILDSNRLEHQEHGKEKASIRPERSTYSVGGTRGTNNNEEATFNANLAVMISTGFRPDKAVSALLNHQKGSIYLQNTQNTHPRGSVDQSSAKIMGHKAQGHMRRSRTFNSIGNNEETTQQFSAPGTPTTRDSSRRLGVKRAAGSPQKALNTPHQHQQQSQQQSIIPVSPPLFEILQFFPASTILYFVTEEAQTSFSDALQRASSLANIAYVRLYDVIPIRNCPGIEECTDYLSVQSKSVGAHIPAAPWQLSPGRQKMSPTRSLMQSSGYNSQGYLRNSAPHMAKLTDDVTLNIQNSANKQAAANAIAASVIDELASSAPAMCYLSKCLNQLVTTCLLAIQEDNILCDTTESVENLKMDADISIRAVSMMVNKNVVGLIKRHLSDNMLYTCGKTVVEQQINDIKHKDGHHAPKSIIKRYNTQEYTIFNSLRTLAKIPPEANLELLELTVAYKKSRNFANLIHALTILCLVGPGVREAFFTGEFMVRLANFVGRLLIDKLTTIQTNSMHTLHISLAALCRLNHSFGFILLPYTTQALYTVFKELVVVTPAVWMPGAGAPIDNARKVSMPSQHLFKSGLLRSFKQDSAMGASTGNLYSKTTYNNTAAIHALNKIVPQTEEERSVCMEHIEYLQDQGITQGTARSQSITIHSMASLLYLHSAALFASMELLNAPTCPETTRAVASASVRYTIDTTGKILQWVSGLSTEMQRIMHGQGLRLPQSALYIMQMLLLPSMYSEQYMFGLSMLELHFHNLEMLANIFVARLLNQAQRAAILTFNDVCTVSAGLIREHDALRLLQDGKNGQDASSHTLVGDNPFHMPATRTRVTSEMGGYIICHGEDIQPEIDLGKVGPSHATQSNENYPNGLSDQEDEKLTDYFVEDNSEVPIDQDPFDHT